ncbi:MAG: hypothetical protein AB8B50_20950 [Pirellulaceae bacterium]
MTQTKCKVSEVDGTGNSQLVTQRNGLRQVLLASLKVGAPVALLALSANWVESLGSRALAAPQENGAASQVETAVHHNRLRLTAENVAVFRASGAVEREDSLHTECLLKEEAEPTQKPGTEQTNAADVANKAKPVEGPVDGPVEETEDSVSSKAVPQVAAKDEKPAKLTDKVNEGSASAKPSDAATTPHQLAFSDRATSRSQVANQAVSEDSPAPFAPLPTSAGSEPDAGTSLSLSDSVTPKHMSEAVSPGPVVEQDSDAGESGPDFIALPSPSGETTPDFLLAGSRRRIGERLRRLVGSQESEKSGDSAGEQPDSDESQELQFRELGPTDLKAWNLDADDASSRIASRVGEPLAEATAGLRERLRGLDTRTTELADRSHAREKVVSSREAFEETLSRLQGLNQSARRLPVSEPRTLREFNAVGESADAMASSRGQLPKTRVDDPLSLEFGDTDAVDGGSSLQLSSPGVVDGKHADHGADEGGLQLSDSGDQECPGAPGEGEPMEDHRPEDVEFEQDAHPYDAPAAQSLAEPDAELAPPVQSFTAREVRIHDGINQTLNYFLQNPETVVRRGPWALMHASLPFGVETEVVAGNRRVNALGWMCYNGVCARQRMFQATKNGFRTNVGPGMQGHEGQFLAILAQSRVQADYPIKIGRKSYTIQDLVRYEMATCRERTELTFKLIGLSHYLEPNQRWRDNRGRTWNLEKMVADEMSQPVNGVACGGTHRLMGLSYAIIERQRAGLPITGTWAKAEAYLNNYVNYTMTLQNPDGSFSTNWFEGRGNKPDMERKVQTTGHMLEWLIYTLPDDYLRSPRIQKSVEYLLSTVGRQPEYNWPIGPRGHALRALVLYNQRVFGAEQGSLKQFVATRGRNMNLR